jgi:hypothetical protein
MEMRPAFSSEWLTFPPREIFRKARKEIENTQLNSSLRPRETLLDSLIKLPYVLRKFALPVGVIHFYPQHGDKILKRARLL